jgi:hypothetical protein
MSYSLTIAALLRCAAAAIDADTKAVPCTKAFAAVSVGAIVSRGRTVERVSGSILGGLGVGVALVKDV